MAFIEPCFGIGHNLSLICQMTSEDIKHQLIIINKNCLENFKFWKEVRRLSDVSRKMTRQKERERLDIRYSNKSPNSHCIRMVFIIRATRLRQHNDRNVLVGQSGGIPFLPGRTIRPPLSDEQGHSFIPATGKKCQCARERERERNQMTAL